MHGNRTIIIMIAVYRFTHVHEHLVFAHQNQQSKHVGWQSMACPTDSHTGDCTRYLGKVCRPSPSRETTATAQ